MQLTEVLAPNRVAHLVEDGIYSVLPDASRAHHYDRRATVYDLLVSTRWYNSIMWGCSPREYVAFAHEALTSSPDGTFLDAGCGSLLFTSEIYLETRRQIVAFDQSLAMLRRARQRLVKAAGCVPEHIVLLQADLGDLPFRALSFRTILCLNVLHQFAEARVLLENMERLLTNGGHLFLTSLILNNRFVGDRYLNALYRMREFVQPRTGSELCGMLSEALHCDVSYSAQGNMAFCKCVGTNTQERRKVNR